MNALRALWLHLRAWWIDYHIAIVKYCQRAAHEDLHAMEEKRFRVRMDLSVLEGNR